MPTASIDIGSNSVLLLVIDDDGNTLHDEAKVVGLGRGLGHRGLFRPERMDAALGVLRRYAEKANELGVAAPSIRAIATSASRRAMNAETFYDTVRQETGIDVSVISGEREAQLTWKGALLGIPVESGPIAVVDLGGGSTEFVVGDPSQQGIIEERSIPVGSVRLTEQFFGESVERYNPAILAQLRSFVDASVAKVNWHTLPKALIAVAGTATTLCAMELGLETWDRSRVHGSRLGRTALRRWIDRLLNTTPDERQALATVSPERADYLLAGACVLEAVCTVSHRDSLWISDGGVRHGVLID